ncbi:MAG: hypothetical protein ACFE9Q_11505 [Candidatus Hodarchaeota archaeon]
MSNNKLFDLDKIKKLTDPIEELQVQLNQLTETSKNATENIKIFEREYVDRNFQVQIENIEDLLEEITSKLSHISKINLNKFLELKDQLIEKYKEGFKDNLKKLNVNQELTKSIGLVLIEDKKISKVIDFVSFIPSIQISQWLDLLDSLKHNTLFLKSVKRFKNYFQDLIQTRFNIELSKIPEGTDSKLIKDYESYFEKDSTLTFSDFLRKIESQLTQQDITEKKSLIKRVREREEIEKLKKKQEEQKETYESYLKLSDREFRRMRRKKSREKLTDISLESKAKKNLKLSNEVSEKIEKFKSQLEKSFNEKYMIQKDEDKDPLDLIRERKKRKEKEYKQYKDHFENP